MIEPVKGELWETRGGELMEIVKVSEDHRVAIMAVDSRKVLTPYRRGGYFISEKYEHMLDLIRRHG